MLGCALDGDGTGRVSGRLETLGNAVPVAARDYLHSSFRHSIFSISSEVPRSMRSLLLWNIRLLQKCARLLLARGTWVLSQVSFLNLMHFMRLNRNLSVSTVFLCCS